MRNQSKEARDMELWKASNARLNLRDFMGARALLLGVESPFDDPKLTKFAAQVVTNYQSIMMGLDRPYDLNMKYLIPDTIESRALKPLALNYFLSERDRLQEELARTKIEPKNEAAFYFHQVLTALGTLDGFRSSFWSCAAIDALQQVIQIDDELSAFRNHSQGEMNKAIAGILEPNDLTATREKTQWSRSNYEGIELLRRRMLSAGISTEHYDKFVLKIAQELDTYNDGRPN
jgi:hypothetical protein